MCDTYELALMCESRNDRHVMLMCDAICTCANVQETTFNEQRHANVCMLTKLALMCEVSAQRAKIYFMLMYDAICACANVQATPRMTTLNGQRHANVCRLTELAHK